MINASLNQNMTRANSVWGVLVILAGGGLYAGLWSAGHNWGADFAAYIMQAISIVDGTADEFVIRNAFTINQSSIPMGPVAYPWGFPLLLAPVYSVFGMNLVAFKAVGLFFYVLYLLTLWYGFRHLLKPVELVVFVALFAFNPAMLLFGDNILSDIPFLFFSTLSIVILGCLHRPRSVGREIALRLILGAAMGAGFLVRTNGVLLVLVYAAMAGFRAWQGRDLLGIVGRAASQRGALIVLPLVAFVLTIGAPLLFLPDGQNSHLGHLSKLSWWFVFNNTIYYAELLKYFFSPGPSWPTLGFILYLLSIPPVLAGIRSSWRESFPMLLYVVLTVGLYVVWPYQQGLRFIFPLVPIYVYFLILGLRVLGQTIARIGEFYTFPLGGLVLAFAVGSTSLAYRNLSQGRPLPQGPYTEHAVEMFAFIRHNTSLDDVIVFRTPRAMRLFTGRPSLMIDRVADVGLGDLLVLAKGRSNQWHQLMVSEKEGLLRDKKIYLAFDNQGFEVYRLIK